MDITKNFFGENHLDYATSLHNLSILYRNIGDYSKAEAGRVLSAVVDAISETLEKGDKITLVGFGTFEVRERAAKDGINPLTKKAIHIPAKKVPAFKPSQALKDAVNK